MSRTFTGNDHAQAIVPKVSGSPGYTGYNDYNGKWHKVSKDSDSGYYNFLDGKISDLSLNAVPNLKIEWINI